MLRTEEELKDFAKNVIKKAKRNLSKKNHSKDLSSSLSYELNVHRNSFSLQFFMMEYGAFVDEGVRGAGGTRKTTSKFKSTNNKGKIWKQKGGNSPYSFTTLKPSPKHFRSWARSKGLSEFAVAESVFRQGIKPSYFFTSAFEDEFSKLSDELLEQFGLDIDDFLEQTLNG